MFFSKVADTAPTYQGPFSTTDSKNVANTFCKNKGLIFSLKGSYSNPIRFILGIDMIRISCFKHEREILLYSQTLPIKATETFADDDETMINHLMHSLQSTTTPINDSKAFLRKMGIQFKSQWIPLILKHPLFERESKYKLQNGKKMIVCDRFIEELGIFKLQEIPLTVYRHRGHLYNVDKYHPRDLLDKKGTETYYFGDEPSFGDWIIFKIERPFIVIPKAVNIRNWSNEYGLKSI